MERDLTQFIAAIHRIPLFHGLKPEQAMVLLKACERVSLGPRETVCAFGDPSDRMFILLSGRLSVYSGEGVRIARIEAVAPVGEMGIFTGEPRSATVRTLEPATLFVLTKARLDLLLRRYPDIELVISRNLIRTLSERIRDANREIAYLSGLLSDQDAGEKARQEGDDSDS